MRHTDEEIERAAERFEQLAEELEPESARVLVTDDLRSVAEAAQTVRDAEAPPAAVQSIQPTRLSATVVSLSPPHLAQLE